MSLWWARPAPCRRTRRDLQTYVDGEADLDTAWRVARHLSRCHDCFTDAGSIRSLKDALAGLRVPPNSDTLARFQALVAALTDARPGT